MNATIDRQAKTTLGPPPAGYEYERDGSTLEQRAEMGDLADQLRALLSVAVPVIDRAFQVISDVRRRREELEREGQTFPEDPTMDATSRALGPLVAVLADFVVATNPSKTVGPSEPGDGIPAGKAAQVFEAALPEIVAKAGGAHLAGIGWSHIRQLRDEGLLSILYERPLGARPDRARFKFSTDGVILVPEVGVIGVRSWVDCPEARVVTGSTFRLDAGSASATAAKAGG